MVDARLSGFVLFSMANRGLQRLGEKKERKKEREKREKGEKKVTMKD